MSKKMSLGAKLAAGAAATMGAVLLGACLLGSAPAKAAGANAPAAPSATSQTVERAYLAQQGAGNGACTGFADANGDGLCDRCGAVPRANHHGCRAFCDANGDGACDACGGKTAGSRAAGRNAPATNDGANQPQGGSAATGNGAAPVCGTCGRAYVDANGDGVCDACGGGRCRNHHGEKGAHHGAHGAHHSPAGANGTYGYGSGNGYAHRYGKRA